MAKASITVPSQSYSPGTRTVNLPNLTTDDNGITITLTRESWPIGSNIISGVIEGSNDGVNWFELTRFSWDGGDQINPRTGLPVTAQWVSVSWPEKLINGVMTPQRPAQARARVTNTVTLTTAITVAGR
jgi:hypothetical protein